MVFIHRVFYVKDSAIHQYIKQEYCYECNLRKRKQTKKVNL